MILSAFPFLLLRSPLNALQHAYQVPDTLNPSFNEGLYLSSTAFWQELIKKDQLSAKAGSKIDRALSKYWIRSCMRSTPYGTFAGTALIDIGDHATSLQFAGDQEHRRHTRIDMDYLAGIISALLRIPQVRQQVKFYPNNSLYEIPGGYRYAEYTINNKIRHYQLTSISNYPYIAAIFARAREGATLENLTQMLEQSEGVEAEEAVCFVEEMLESQLLISALEPCITGNDPLDTLVGQLSGFVGVEGILSALKKVQDLLREPAKSVAHYRAVEAILESICVLKETPGHSLQTDLYLAINQNWINKDLIAAIIQQARDLFQLSTLYVNPELDEFKSRFQSKYEEAEVPLPIALDIDLGIGYGGLRDECSTPGDLLDTLETPNTAKRINSPPDYIEQFVFSKYNNYLKDAGDSVVITSEDLAGLRKHTEHFQFSDGLFLMGGLMSQDGLLDPEHFLFDMSALSGPSAANLFGRFISGNEQLGAFAQQILKTEEAAYPDAVFAELVHLPQARTANILLRPVLRNYEIPYLGKSGAPAARQILVDDLMISIRNNEIYLRSRRLDKRVIPRLTTAHNFTLGSLPVYRLLCDLQFQGTAFPNAWNWAALNALRHLPRVSYKNLILRKARWKIGEKDVAGLPGDVSAYPAYFVAFRKLHKLPDRVVYAEADNELLIDFREARGIDLFLHYLKRQKHILLEEFLFTEDNCIVKDANGHSHTNEMIIPMYRDVRPQTQPSTIQADHAVTRKFLPNSEWQYFKVYCGSKSAEDVLANTLLPFIERGLITGLFERFFFVRYRDDWNHLRIRFYNADVSKQGILQTSFMEELQPLMHSGVVDKVLLDTYSREIERYGPDLIEEAEMLFHNDSLAVLRFLRLLDEANDEQYRMLLALRSIDMLLDDFGFDLAQKRAFLKSLQADFFREFGARPSLKKQLNEQYRRKQADVFAYLNPANDLRLEIDEAVGVFRVRSDMNQLIIPAIRNKITADESLNAFVQAHLHMSMNRLFPVQQRKYELVAYHFMEKYYASQLAIWKKTDHLESSILRPSPLT